MILGSNICKILMETTESLVKSAMVAALLGLLFAVTSTIITLRDSASAILEKVAAQSKVCIVLVKQFLVNFPNSNPIINFTPNFNSLQKF